MFVTDVCAHLASYKTCAPPEKPRKRNPSVCTLPEKPRKRKPSFWTLHEKPHNRNYLGLHSPERVPQGPRAFQVSTRNSEISV